MIVHRVPPPRFGRRTAAIEAPTFSVSDVRLFALTYLGGAVFVLTLFG